MSMTAEGMIFIKPESVTSYRSKEYGRRKDNHYAVRCFKAQQLNGFSARSCRRLDSFSVVYTIDKDGYCTSMEQTGTATKDGVQSKVDYLMTVSHMNDIASVSKPQVQESADKSDAE